jgi:hypothetical protein
MGSKRTIVLVLLLSAPLAALAQSYRCTGKDGKKYYGATVPQQCVGVVVEQLSASGTVMKRIDPQANVDDTAKKEAAEAERRKQEAIAKEQSRRDQALLATYASEKDVEDVRKRALEDNQRLSSQIEAQMAALKPRADKGDTNAAKDLQMQQTLLDTKKKEAAAINAKYDEDRRRYLELTGKGK